MSFDHDYVVYIVPALIGFFTGVLAPIIIEKWKIKTEERRKISSIENDILNLQTLFRDFSSALEPRLTYIEEKVRVLEINLSHNTGVMKGQNPDAPLQDTTSKVESSFAVNSPN